MHPMFYRLPTFYLMTFCNPLFSLFSPAGRNNYLTDLD
jgi:hypothetical protein